MVHRYKNNVHFEEFFVFYHIQNGFFTVNPFKKLDDIIIRMLNVRLVRLIVMQCAGQSDSDKISKLCMKKYKTDAYDPCHRLISNKRREQNKKKM